MWLFCEKAGRQFGRCDRRPGCGTGKADGERLGLAWLALCFALALHVLDEAVTGFLGVYNPTVAALRARMPWLPLPRFTFGIWLGGLLAGITLLLFLARYAFRNAPWIHLTGYLFAAAMTLNAGLHIVATLLGHTIASVRFAAAAPGFYSSGLLLVAAINLFAQLRRTGKGRRGPVVAGPRGWGAEMPSGRAPGGGPPPRLGTG